MGTNESELRFIAMRQKASSLLEENYVDTHSAWVEGHLELLCELRRIVGNDLDKVIIMGVIGQRMFKSIVAESDSYHGIAGGNYDIDHSRLTNVESIAASTGIPRESVRRKVVELVDSGWIARDDGGRLYVLPEAGVQLEKCTAVERNFISMTIARILTFIGADMG